MDCEDPGCYFDDYCNIEVAENPLGPHGSYNMIGLRSLNGRAGNPGVLQFNGIDLERWPGNVMVLDHYFTNNTSDKLILVRPVDFDTETYYPATIQFLVYNEYMQRFSTSIQQGSPYFESELTLIDTSQPDRSIFSSSVSGTTFGQTRITPVAGGNPMSTTALIGLYVHYDSKEHTLANAYSGIYTLATTCSGSTCPIVNMHYPT